MSRIKRLFTGYVNCTLPTNCFKKMLLLDTEICLRKVFHLELENQSRIDNNMKISVIED